MANHKNFAETTLASAIADTSGTSITVTSETSFPSAPFIISIDTEAFLVGTVAGTTWTVTRGYEGSTAATHLNGAAIFHDISAAEADAIATKLPLAGGTLTGNLVMDNMDITLVKLLTLHGEIDDGNSGVTDIIDWNTGAAHKSTLTGNVTLAFTGQGLTVVPDMTDYTAPSGIVSDSAHYGAYYGWKAFNSDINDYWNPEAALPQWIQYQFVTAKTIITYGVMYYSNAPTAWTLEGSNNGTDFTTIDTRSSQSLTGSVMAYYTVTTPGSYVYYRWIITAGSMYSDILSLALIDTGINDPATPCFLTLKLVQDATGGRTVTWPATVKGTPNIDAAASSTSIVYLYWDGTNYYVVNEAGSATVADQSITYAKIQHISATDKLLGRVTAGAGDVEEIACTATGRSILDDTSTGAVIATLGLDADIATLALPANTTITAAGAELINDVDAAAQRATLGTAAYSEGTWNPVLNGFTIVGSEPAVSGTYKKIGNLVFITCTINAGAGGNTSVAATGGGTSYIGTLPVSVVGMSACIIADAYATRVVGQGNVEGTRIQPSSFSACSNALVLTATYNA